MELRRVSLLMGMASLLCFNLAHASPHSIFQDRIGTLVTTVGDSCVATLLRSDVLLTPAHCLFGKDGIPVKREAFHFRSHLDSHVAAGVAEVSLLMGFDPTQGAVGESIANDLALVRLDRALGDFPLPSYGETVLPGDEVELLRSGADNPTRCTVAEVVGGLFTLDCQVSLGDSGAPLVRMTPRATELVGIVSAFETDENAYTAIAVGLGDKLRELFARLDIDRWLKH